MKSFLSFLDEDDAEFAYRMRQEKIERINKLREIIRLKYTIIMEKNPDLVLEYAPFQKFHLDQKLIFGKDLISRILIHDDNKITVLTRAFIYTTDTYPNLISSNSKLCIDCKIELREVLHKPPLFEESA